jgi:hypothetical protein
VNLSDSKIGIKPLLCSTPTVSNSTQYLSEHSQRCWKTDTEDINCAGGVAQVIECLPSVSSNPVPPGVLHLILGFLNCLLFSECQSAISFKEISETALKILRNYTNERCNKAVPPKIGC